MQPTELTSAKNPILRDLASLQEKASVRKERRRLVIEGERACCEAFRQSLVLRRWIWSHEAWGAPRLAGIRKTLRQNEGIGLWLASEPALRSISALETVPTMVAELDWPAVELSSLLRAGSAESFYVVLDKIQDPGNVGTILRTAEAMGAGGAILTAGTADPYNPKALRASSLSTLRFPHARDVDPVRAADAFRSRRMSVYLASPREGVAVFDAEIQRPAALVFGNEGAGVSTSEWPGGTPITVPVSGRAESLNVAASAAILLYEAARTRGGGPKEEESNSHRTRKFREMERPHS